LQDERRPERRQSNTVIQPDFIVEEKQDEDAILTAALEKLKAQ